MTRLDEADISRTILEAYHAKLGGRVRGDVAIVGAGPSGLTAALYLAREGFEVTLFEKRLSPGGGVWGGGMAMNEAVVQDDALGILDDARIRHRACGAGLHTVDAAELASGLCFEAIQSGAVLLNLMTIEDVCVRNERVTGVVANRSMIGGALPVDPLVFSAKAVVDATGHDAAVVASLAKRGLLASPQPGEGPMDATEGERFVVERAAEVYPGLWVSGMSVCTTFGGPRMGPIFGGMLLSGKRVGDLIADVLKQNT